MFIGDGMDERVICARLDACLLSEAELVAGPHAWRTLEDPFPVWEAEPAQAA